jgi:glycine oxidase
MNFQTSFDVVVVGGGVIGLSIARALRRGGAGRIGVLDRGSVGRESSYAAAGMLAPQSEADRNDDFFQLCVESNRLYHDFALQLFEETRIDVELNETGTLYLAFTDADVSEINHRFSWQADAGLSVESLTAAEALFIEPEISDSVRAALRFPADHQVENRKLIQALRRFAELNCIEIIENTRVGKLLYSNASVCGVDSSAGKFHADTVVLAAGAWTSAIDSAPCPIPPVKPIRGQIICFDQASKLFRHVVYSPRGYIVPRRDGRLVAGATVENVGFDKSVTSEGTRIVRQNAVEISSKLTEFSISEMWAGLRPFVDGGLPVIGGIPGCKNLFIASGHYRNGILLAPKTAEMVAAQITQNVESPYLSIFGPGAGRVGT